jgi:hypothetical protein
VSETSEIVTPGLSFINGLPGCIATRGQGGVARVKGSFVRLGRDGWPDIDAHISGWWTLFEAKTDKGKLRQLMVQIRQAIRDGTLADFTVPNV